MEAMIAIPPQNGNRPGVSGSEAEDFEHLSVSPELSSEFRQAFDSHGGVAGIVTYLHEKADEWKSIPIDIGFTGNSGAGKSSFINALRGLYADDPGAAAVGVNEGTTIPTPYLHPRNESFKLWDLPGVGTPNFPKDSYLQKVELAKKDFFLIMSSERFKENDAWLASQITAAGKKFYFVRTKVGQDVKNELKSHRVKPSEESVLRKIRDNLRENLDSIGCPNAQVFLIDSHKTSRFDFGKLEASLVEDFPKLKKEALLFSLGNMSDAVLEAKMAALRRRAKNASIASGLIAAVPIPGLSLVSDLGILAIEIEFAFKQLGLDQQSLRITAYLTGSNFEDLQGIVANSPVGIFAFQMSRQAIEMGLKQLAKKVPAYAAALATEEFSRFIPFIGPVMAGSISLGTNYWLLKNFLDEMHQVADKVLKKSLQKTADNITTTVH